MNTPNNSSQDYDGVKRIPNQRNTLFEEQSFQDPDSLVELTHTTTTCSNGIFMTRTITWFISLREFMECDKPFATEPSFR